MMEALMVPPQHCSTTVQVFFDFLRACTSLLKDADVNADMLVSFLMFSYYTGSTVRVCMDARSNLSLEYMYVRPYEHRHYTSSWSGSINHLHRQPFISHQCDDVVFFWTSRLTLDVLKTTRSIFFVVSCFAFQNENTFHRQ